MLEHRTIILKKFLGEFDYIIMQNFSDILLLFCTPTSLSHHVGENQEYHTGKALIISLRKAARLDYYVHVLMILYVCNFFFFQG